MTFGVRLTVAGNGMEAEAVCGLLRSEGIACNHRQADIGVGAWEAVGVGGPREILVDRSDLERARSLTDSGRDDLRRDRGDD